MIWRQGCGNCRWTWLSVLAVAFLSWSCAPREPHPMDLARGLDALQAISAVPAIPSVSDMEASYDRMGGNMDWADLKACWIGDDRYVLADLKGPGCVRRIWQTNVGADEWLFYFDGESEPRIRCAERDLFAIGTAGRFPFVPPLVDALSGGVYCYVPLPYRKSLKVVVRLPKARPDARPYFHVNYETYPPETRVDSYPKTMTPEAKRAVETAISGWLKVEEGMQAVAGRLAFQSLSVLPGGSVMVFEPANPSGTIVTLAFRLDDGGGLTTLQRTRVLRNLVLRCSWDGTAEPSVNVPLGDFFCNGLHPRRFVSLPMANVEGAWICRFPMPFRKGAKIEIRNDGPFAVSFQAAVETTPGEPAGAARYFHAAWNQASNGGAPFRIMRTEGKGDFMGCYLIALGADGSWNILEGDERFFRDGELRPVHHGTGLEDYFNAGWYYYGLFERPLTGLLEKAAMRTCQYRFQIPDPVTFERSLQMQIEFGDGNRAKGYMSAASYWYQDKPGPAGSAIPEADRRFPAIDRVGVEASMCEIFELERAGLDREAEERSAYYAELLGDGPLGQLYALRALAYREIREGGAAVRDAYRAAAEKTGVAPEVAEQARLLLWRSEKPHRALFGGSAYSTFTLFVDGKKIGEGSDPFVYRAFPAELSPGSHLLQAEIQSKGEMSWYSLGFFSDFTNVVSDISWDYSLDRPAGWPVGEGDPSLWKPYSTTLEIFPSMQWWQFAPNAFPCVQSSRQVGGPVGGWEKPAGRTIYLRRRIHVPSEPGRRCNPFIRRKEHRIAAVRPPGDTSNENLTRGTEIQP